MKHLELFSGYGTSSFALKRLGIDSECIGYSDIDKYANQCFAMNHSGKQLGDVKLINANDLEDFDLLTGGFPCQAFSVAGKQLGELDPRGTLFYEIIRIAEVKKPKYMLLENVKGLCSKKFKSTFDKILSELDRIGYDVHWKVLNTKDYGIPQNRERVWFVCFRKDIEHTFEFPEKEELKLFVKDILEEEVDNKYYLSEKLQERFRKYLEEKQKKLGNEPAILDLYNKKVKTDGTSITLSDPCHNNLRLIEGQGIVAIRSYPRTGTKEADEQTPVDPAGVEGPGGNNVPMVQEVSSTLTTELAHSTGRDFIRSGQAEKISNSCGKLRRLTPKECFRLQGFLNDEVNLEGLSDTQCYKLAGNGQDVNVVSLILKNMLLKDGGLI